MKKRKMQHYRSYQFIDKDPIIDRVRTVVQDSKESYQKLSEESGVSTTTFYNWFHGDTRRPQFCTVAAILLSQGVKSIDLGALTRGSGKSR